jgi:hypothetical protein
VPERIPVEEWIRVSEALTSDEPGEQPVHTPPPGETTPAVGRNERANRTTAGIHGVPACFDVWNRPWFRRLVDAGHRRMITIQTVVS